MQLVDGKMGQQKKVISLSNKVGELIESKQPLLTSNNAGDNITITGNGDNVKISATGGGNVDENRIFNNQDDKDNTTRLVNEIIKTNVGGKT